MRKKFRDIMQSSRVMIQYLLGVKNNIALFFSPCDKKGKEDGVKFFNGYVTNIHKRIFWYKMFDKLGHNSYADIFSQVDSKKIPKSIILFAHPNDGRDGLLVNPSFTRSSPEIKLDWWKCNIRYDWLFAHVCEGAKILEKPDWRAIFSNWLSYSDDILSFVATKKGDACWREVTHAILKEIPQIVCVKSMKEQLVKIYSSFMEKLYDTNDPRSGDGLNIVCLERCIQSIKTSEDD